MIFYRTIQNVKFNYICLKGSKWGDEILHVRWSSSFMNICNVKNAVYALPASESPIYSLYEEPYIIMKGEGEREPMSHLVSSRKERTRSPRSLRMLSVKDVRVGSSSLAKSTKMKTWRWHHIKVPLSTPWYTDTIIIIQPIQYVDLLYQGYDILFVFLNKRVMKFQHGEIQAKGGSMSAKLA